MLEKRLHESSEIFVEHMPPAVSCVAGIQSRTQDKKTVSREIDKVGTIYVPIHQVPTTQIAVRLVRRAQIWLSYQFADAPTQKASSTIEN